MSRVTERPDAATVWPTRAAVWAGWGGAVVLCLQSSTTGWFGAGVVVSVALTWRLVAPGRTAGLGVVVTGLATVVAAVWFLIGMLLRREGAGGEVVWILPQRDFASGGDFGGAVTLGQLQAALTNAAGAVALVAALGLLYRVVSGSGWVRLGELVLGSGSAVVAPIAFLGQAVAEQAEERTAVRRGGSGPVGPGVGEVWSRALSTGQDWMDTEAPRSPMRQSLRLVVTTGVAAAVLVLAVTQRTVSGPVLVAAGVAVLLVLGTLAAGGRPEPLRGGEIAALTSAVGLAACWWWQPGDGYAVAAAAVLPGLALLGTERTR